MMLRLLAVVTLSLSLSANAAAATYWGPRTPLGAGSARVAVSTDIAGNPAAIMIVLTGNALNGLPRKDKPTGWTYLLPAPSGIKTGIDHVSIDWNPQGHEPPEIYGFPHFDFHFYTITKSQQLAIAFPKGPKDSAAVVSDASLVAPTYRIFPEAAIPQMGVHAFSVASPEFQHKRFTTTLLYGYYENRLIFVEPMITRAFLLSHPDVTMSIPTPKKYSSAGWYPSKYVVRYDAARNTYVIALIGLRRWE